MHREWEAEGERECWTPHSWAPLSTRWSQSSHRDHWPTCVAALRLSQLLVHRLCPLQQQQLQLLLQVVVLLLCRLTALALLVHLLKQALLLQQGGGEGGGRLLVLGAVGSLPRFAVGQR